MTRWKWFAGLWAVVLLGSVQPARGQTATIMSDQIVPIVPGLRLLTIQSTPTECLALFVISVDPRVMTDVTPPTGGTPEAVDSALRRIQTAAESRDRQLAALRARNPGGMATGQVGQVDATRQVAYELERLRIEAEWDRVLRNEIPGSAPWASPMAGTKSGGFEDMATALRRALVDGDPTSGIKTLSDRLTRLEELMAQMVAAPRLAASGPVRCPTGR